MCKKEGIKYMMCFKTHLTLLLASSKKNSREFKSKQSKFISCEGIPQVMNAENRKAQFPLIKFVYVCFYL
jgi:hypothetical protein